MKHNYSDFSDFLKDNDFLRWQILPDEPINNNWEEFQKNNPHLQDEINKAKSYLKNTILNKSTLSSFDREALLNNIKTDIKDKTRKTKNRFYIKLSVWSAAAVILLIISLKIFNNFYTDKEIFTGTLLNDVDIQLVMSDSIMTFKQDIQVEFDNQGYASIIQNNIEGKKTLNLAKSKSNKLIVPYGKRSTITLSDGSKVWLNSGSVLEFPARFDNKRREITLLSGEIYVDVVEDKDSPFFVNTPDINVKVLGTQFNVTNYTDLPPSVILVEGSISVQFFNTGDNILIPGEKVEYTSSGMIEKHNVNVEEFVSWKDGYLIFDNISLADVLKQVERYYNLSVDYQQSEDINQITCNGKLVLSENIDVVMNAIAILSESTYERRNNIFYFINNSN